MTKTASIKRIDGKNKVSFLITVSAGKDINGKQIRKYMTWVPDKKMTENQLQKAVEKVAYDFERSIESGYQVDKITFAEYADYVLKVKAKSGAKFRTIERYRELLERINIAIGNIRISDIRPQHLNALYDNLSEDGVASFSSKAVAKKSISDLLKKNNLSKAKVSELSGLAASTIGAMCQNKAVNLSTAEKLCECLGLDFSEWFDVESADKTTLSSKTILEHHRLIHTILAQAEKEMLVPYNAADKASPPKSSRKEVNYFQPEDISRIMDALETEPIKWRTITELLIVTGCRRGEIMGLKWDKVDFENSIIKIDSNLLYSSKRGIYEDTTKTESSVRYVKVPEHTMKLLSEYRDWYDDLKRNNGDRWKETGYCFTKDDGTPMIPDSITAWLRKFSEKHGLPHINPHAFRHTMASILINSGKDIVSVSKRLGHSKTSTTTDIYAHIIKESDAQSSDIISDMIFNQKSDNKK